MFHLIIINRNQNTMAHTKQTPRNPNVDRPATALGSDVQPKRRTTSKEMSKKLPDERRKTTLKTSVTKTSKMRQTHYWRT